MWGGWVKMEDIPDFSNLFLASQLLWPTPLAGTPPPPNHAHPPPCHHKGKVNRIREAGRSDCHHVVMTLAQHQPSLPPDILICEKPKPPQA